jgi:hypothetical protein
LNQADAKRRRDRRSERDEPERSVERVDQAFLGYATAWPRMPGRFDAIATRADRAALPRSPELAGPARTDYGLMTGTAGNLTAGR